MKEKIVRFCVSLPQYLLEELDRKIIKRGYSSRSELVRDLIRELMVEDAWREEEEVIGVLTLIYDHHQRELAQKMLEIQHNQYVKVLCSTHIHLDHHNCLENIVLKGKPNEIESISINIGGLRGVKFAKLTKASNV
ncbi:nickel-responsive transcriptional regulator NikR [Hydrogenobacter hydrogenophilus]|uniref:Putative nickel-responsive regulator n=1 Tax=Hydrogenobacter hydrogenophilus TaxID=35835 RepID=A0A285NX81_9AQUI|nr:nickel-responsive transcriptional regulator NikR [Hydrogenobacter hydrogenophilus]SNZ13647.1 CopG family transcriptional regulator, nickel-responsive regulator [Hydrogenobacter hydrogenophilus]